MKQLRGGCPCQRIALSIAGWALWGCGTSSVTSPETVPVANVVSETSSSETGDRSTSTTRLIYQQGDGERLTTTDVALVLALSLTSEPQPSTSALVTATNRLLPQANAVTAGNLLPLPTAETTDFVSSGAGDSQPNLADVQVLYAALQLPAAARDRETLAAVANRITSGTSLQATDIETVPGEAIPGLGDPAPLGAQQVLHSLGERADGNAPIGGLIQASDGNFYGTARDGGAEGNGTFFRLTPGGDYTVLYAFQGSFPSFSNDNPLDAGNPEGELLEGADGNFYGTSFNGGEFECLRAGCGTVYRVTPEGDIAIVHDFNGLDGETPTAGLIIGNDGAFYGTTRDGGEFDNGTVFRVTPEGDFIRLHSFSIGDGSSPSAKLVLGPDGNFYGTTQFGGIENSGGTVFRITPSGLLITLYTFAFNDNRDGEEPQAGLVLAEDGNFYGTTREGGFSNGGTVFRITPEGELTTLHSFRDIADGSSPIGGLIQASDSWLYGTVKFNGPRGSGVVYRIRVDGEFEIVHSFSGDDGGQPEGLLLQATDGSFYGTTENGGTANSFDGGTAYRIPVTP
ncbi:MAG: choice-of-anchor tandem repeat GloVer-containing protein [Cyanobacteria bacterium J06642_2]